MKSSRCPNLVSRTRRFYDFHLPIVGPAAPVTLHVSDRLVLSLVMGHAEDRTALPASVAASIGFNGRLRHRPVSGSGRLRANTTCGQKPGPRAVSAAGRAAGSTR